VSFLRTVITYNLASEAEVDKAYLESNGLTVCLLNANTARNELGAPFYIQLQVADAEYDQAVELLRSVNPQRFGSPQRVAQLEKEIIRATIRFVTVALLVGVAAFFTIPKPSINSQNYFEMSPDWRLPGAMLAGILGGIFALRTARKQ
jgi:hypothetical protein